MMTDAAASPLRVGLIGLGRPGLHLIERFAAGGPFQIVAAFNDSTTADVVSPFGIRLETKLQELLTSADIDVVWMTEFCGQQHGFVLPDVLATKHAVLETPLGVTPAVLDRAFQVAHQRGRQLLVRHPRRCDADFLQASTVAQDRSLGPIRSAKLVSWTYGLPPRGAFRGSGLLSPDRLADAQVTKVQFAAHILDQLVPLIGDRPLCVLATSDSTVGMPGLFAGFSLTLQILFEHGCQAEIDIRLNSPAQFQSGWMLTAEQGGYSKGRRFTLTEEGEIFDSPVSLAIGDNDTDQFDWLAQQIRSDQRDLVEESRVRTVVALLDGAQRSIESRQAVDL